MKKKELLSKAINLRIAGFSVKEIALEMGISKSTSSSWLREVEISAEGQLRLLRKVKKGQIVSAENKRRAKQEKIHGMLLQGAKLLEDTKFDSVSKKTLCSMIYWCEGGKDDSLIKFTNSDPQLVKTFLDLFRQSFRIDENKFKAIVHIHDYHNDQLQKKFWSEVTGIPVKNFYQSWHKKNGGKRIRKDYQGCIAINYYSADIAQQLLSFAKAFMSTIK